MASLNISNFDFCFNLLFYFLQVAEVCAANKQSEEELLRLQEAYIIKLAEAHQKESKKDEKDCAGGMDVQSEEMQIVPIDIFGDSIIENESNEEKDEFCV